VVASTGAAALMVGGTTFHSFFGLGLMEGGREAAVAKASSNKPLRKRLKKTERIVIDEVSMLSAAAIDAAEEIARGSRGKDEPWGGMRVIAVGDFHQLPPVAKAGATREWAFSAGAWAASAFAPAVLATVVRTEDAEFIRILHQIRRGIVSEEVAAFLESRVLRGTEEFAGTRLYPHRRPVEGYNLTRLAALPGRPCYVPTVYKGEGADLAALKRNLPIGDVLALKPGALVMVRTNDPLRRWVNGSTGHVVDLSEAALTIELLDGDVIELEPHDFEYVRPEGFVAATARNFPVTLAWALTIHKAQGCTLDRALIAIDGAWEPGQAYVALSRLRSPEGLFISNWRREGIVADPEVTAFYQSLEPGCTSR
jgi:ATP-dependent exoDNAse (exonuclease V) alpha subunit